MKMVSANLVGAVLSLFIGACTTTVPVAVIGGDGLVLRGTATADMSGGTFQVTDGILTCAGSYDSWNLSVTINMLVHCSDGRKGMAIVTREASGIAGSGRVRLNDGMEADFIFGEAARAF